MMEDRDFAELSSFIQQLIREEWERRNGANNQAAAEHKQTALKTNGGHPKSTAA